MRVTAIGRYHTAADKFALGIDADTLVGTITLSDADGMFTGNPINHQAIHVGVDKALTTVDGDIGTVTSVPFTYLGAAARAKVTCQQSVPGAGFEIVSEVNGSILLSHGLQAFDFGAVQLAA